MQIFVNSMSVKYRMLLDASAEGTIKNKTPAEVEELIETMCRNEYNKTEDIDERDILLGKMVTSELEVERLVKKIEEIHPNYGGSNEQTSTKGGRSGGMPGSEPPQHTDRSSGATKTNQEDEHWNQSWLATT
jgi:hypothetical protein